MKNITTHNNAQCSVINAACLRSKSTCTRALLILPAFATADIVSFHLQPDTMKTACLISNSRGP